SAGRNNILNVVITAAGMPAGGAVASLIGFSAGSSSEWRTVFYVGGVAPLSLAPLMLYLLPESSLYQQAKSLRAGVSDRLGVRYTLFHRARVRQTLLLWIACFCAAVITHLLLNWMPHLMLAKGFTRPEAFLIQIVFNLSASAGSVLFAWRMQR